MHVLQRAKSVALGDVVINNRTWLGALICKQKMTA